MNDDHSEGIPSNILLGVYQNANRIAGLTPLIERIPELVVDGVTKALEERAIGAGTVTTAGLQDTIHRALVDSGLLALVNRGGAQAASQRDPPEPEQTNIQPYYWKGRYHRIPEDFTFPKSSPLNCWQLWCLGDTVKRYPPYKHLEPIDIPDKIRKRLSDFRFLMKKLENELRSNDEYIVNPTDIEQVNQMYEKAKHTIEIEEVTEKKRRRRDGQLMWSTVVNILRKNKM